MLARGGTGEGEVKSGGALDGDEVEVKGVVWAAVMEERIR